MILERVNSLSVNDKEINFQLGRWIYTLIDSLNTTIEQIESVILIPSTITGITQLAEVSVKYIPTNNALTTITLPAKCNVGDISGIVGMGSGGWELDPNSGQTIQIEGSTASVSIASADRYDSITVQCVVQDTTWVVTSYVSAGLIIT